MHVVSCTCCSCGGVCKVVLCRRHACGAVYMLSRVHVVHVVLCTCGIVYTLYRWCGVHVASVHIV